MRLAKEILLGITLICLTSSGYAQMEETNANWKPTPRKHLLVTGAAGSGAVIYPSSSSNFERTFTPSWFANLGVGTDLPGSLRWLAFYTTLGFESRSYYERLTNREGALLDNEQAFDRSYRANFVTMNAMISYRGFISFGPSLLIPVSEQLTTHITSDNWETHALSVTGAQLGLTGLVNLPLWIGKNYDRGLGLSLYYNYPTFGLGGNNRYTMPMLGVGLIYGSDLNERVRDYHH